MSRSSRLGRVRTVGALLSLVLLASGCGSTVRATVDTAAGTVTDVAQVPADGLSVPGATTNGTGTGARAGTTRPGTGGGPAAPGTSAGTSAGTTTGTTGSGAGAAGGTGGTTGGGATPSGSTGTSPGGSPAAPGGGEQPPAPGAAAGAASPATGQGFDETTIRIGFGNVPGASAAIEALGISGTSSIDQVAAMRAIVADINATGGIGGRQVEVVQHDHNAQDSIFNPDQAAQVACAAWTEDTQVFAVTRPAMIDATQITACLDAAGTPLINPGGLQGNQAFYQDFYDRYPNYYNIGAMEAGAYDRVAIRRLVERGFFEPWDTTVGGPATGPTAPAPTIAIVAVEDEHGDRTIESIGAQLAAHGLAFDEVVRSSGRIDQATTEASSQVLQFRSAGVTHVFGVDVAFQTAAESQGYRPRYFLPSALNLIAQTSPAGNLRGAMGESIAPASDTNAATYPGSPSAAADRCLSVLEAAGVQPASNADLWVAHLLCDAFYPLRDAIQASGQLSNDGLRQGFVALGTQPVSAVTWTFGMTDRVRASGQAVRDIAFDESCTCFAYTDSTNHSP